MLRLPSKLLLAILLFSSSVQGAEMLAHGNDQAMWIAVVAEAPRGEAGMRTRIRMKAFGGDSIWRELQSFNGRVVGLASRGQMLAALLDSGDWIMTYPNGQSAGPSLPSKQKIQLMTSEKDVIYAIARKGPAPSTSASTEPSITTLPSTEPADSRETGLELYKLETSKWEKVADLPTDLPQQDRRMKLAVFGGKPMLAITGKGGVIRIVQLDEPGKWVDKGTVASKKDPKFFEILNIDSRPAVWVADSESGAQVSFWMDSGFAPGTDLALKKPLDKKSVRDAIFAKGNIREIILVDQKLFEQCYRPDGSPSSELVELAQPRLPVSPVSNLPSTLLMIALAVLILSSMRRGETEEPVALQSLSVRLAPLGTRMLAAIIDLAPVIAAGVYLQIRYTDEGMTSEDVAWPLILGVSLYLLHTTILELLAARSIGKFCCGLKVVSIDGGKASFTSLLLRNLLRAVDLFPLFPLAIMISFTPMRQRVGDITARTIVISLREPSEEQSDDSPADSAD